jgi:hypothetical protein
MSKTNHNIAFQRKGTVIAASFFLLIATFLLTGILPQCLKYIDADYIEFSETLEGESDEVKTEKEKGTDKKTEKHHSQLVLSTLNNSKELQNPDDHFYKWKNPSTNIITPPPEFI